MANDRDGHGRSGGYYGADVEQSRGYGHHLASDLDSPQSRSFRGRGPKNYKRSDERIYEDVCERLQDDPSVDAGAIEVAVHGGAVILSGRVEDILQKRRTEDVVEDVSGVKNVQNNVRVGRSS